MSRFPRLSRGMPVRVALLVATLSLAGAMPVAAGHPGHARGPASSGPTPVVLFPAWHFTRLTVTVRNQRTDPACPRSGSFVDLVFEDPGPTFSQVCRDELLTLRYDGSRRKPIRLRFHEQRGVTVRIVDYGKTASAPFYEPMYRALEAAGYTRDRDIRVAGYDARLTPDMAGFLQRTKRLIERTWRDNGRRPVHLVGHSNGPIYAQYLLTHTSRAWKAKYIHGFTPLAGNFPGQGLGYALMFVGLNVPDVTFPATSENAVSSARMFLSHPSTYITASDPRIFGDLEVVIRDQSTGRSYTPQDYPRLLQRCRSRLGPADRPALHWRCAVRRSGALPERRRVCREGLRDRDPGRAGSGRSDRRPARHRHDGAHHPGRRHQPGGPHERRGHGLERDALLALQPDRLPGREPLRPAERPGCPRPADRERQRAAVALPLAMGSGPPTTVDEVLADLPPDRRAIVEGVCEVVRRNLPAGFEEGITYGMIGWYVPLARFPDTYNGQPLGLAAIASQKRHVSLYLNSVYGDRETERWFRERWAATGRRLDMGKSCVRFRRLEDLPLDVIGETIARTPLDRFVARYLEARGSSRSTRASSGDAATAEPRGPEKT